VRASRAARSLSHTVTAVTFSPGTVVDVTSPLTITKPPTAYVKMDCAVVTIPNACVLDGLGANTILSVTGSTVDLVGIRFQNGAASVANSRDYLSGGAIYATASTVSALSCEFVDNIATSTSSQGSGGGTH